MEKIQSAEKLNILYKTLRWLAFLPAAIGGLIIGGFVVNLLFWLQSWFVGADADSGWAKINYYIFSSAVSSMLAVYWGTRVAPSGKKIVALVLGGVMVALSTVGVFDAIMSQQSDFLWTILSCVSMTIAAGYVVYQFFTKGEDFSLSD